MAGMTKINIRPVEMTFDFCLFCCTSQHVTKINIGPKKDNIGFMYCDDCGYFATNYIQKYILNGYGNANVFRDRIFGVWINHDGERIFENGWKLDENRPFVYNNTNNPCFINYSDDNDPCFDKHDYINYVYQNYNKYLNPNYDTVNCISPTGYNLQFLITDLLRMNDMI